MIARRSAVFFGQQLPALYCLDYLARSYRQHVARLPHINIAHSAGEPRVVSHKLADGRVSAVVGTHTHVPTADEEILPHGTAYITDIGMTGPYDSVIGLDKQVAIRKFTTRLPEKFVVATGDARLSAVLIEVEESTGKAKKILRIQERVAT